MCRTHCRQPRCLGVESTPDHTPATIWAPALIPASPSIKAAAAEQKHDNDDDEKSCHIHDGVSFGQTFGNLISPTSRRPWLRIGARAAPTISLWRPALRP